MSGKKSQTSFWFEGIAAFCQSIYIFASSNRHCQELRFCLDVALKCKYFLWLWKVKHERYPWKKDWLEYRRRCFLSSKHRNQWITCSLLALFSVSFEKEFASLLKFLALQPASRIFAWNGESKFSLNNFSLLF